MKTFTLASLALLFIAAVASADINAPNAISTLTVGTGHTTAALSWTAPGDACTNATVYAYDIRYSTSPIDACNFESASVITPSTPQSPGSTECYDVPVGTLAASTTYYFAVRSRDSAGNWSLISNVVSKATKASGAEVAC